ncbi:MAG TPA: PspA/IM30 family protein [Candidatus Limnocylindrales bacterium]|jgi:phage shock protein A
MVQSSILGRVGQLVRANINAILDSAEDPEKMLDQMVRDYTESIREAEEAVAQTIGNLRLQEDDAKEAGEAAEEWGSKAAAASKKADELRASGTTTEADRFDNLAKIALKRQISYEEQVEAFRPQIEQQTALVDQLKNGLNVMRAKREELVQKKDQLIARAKMAQAQMQVQQSIKSVNIMDPTSEVARFEERIRHEEAQARGMQEVAASSLDAQFASLDDAADDAEVDARLAALKSGG